MSVYNEGLVENHLRNLQDLMKILDCPRKEVYIIKKQAEEVDESAANSKVNELLSSMIVNDPDDSTLSEDIKFNKHLHTLKSQKNIMKLSIGKEDSKLTVYIRGIFDHRASTKAVKTRNFLPWHLLKGHLFPFFTAVELFHYRLVSPLWKEIISGMWHSIFKREMYTQFLVTNFTREIEKSFKLLAVRQPIAQKFFIYATSLSEMINWAEVLQLAREEGRLQKKARLLLTTLMKLMNHQSLLISRLSEYDQMTWLLVEQMLPQDIKSHIQAFTAGASSFPHIQDMER